MERYEGERKGLDKMSDSEDVHDAVFWVKE